MKYLLVVILIKGFSIDVQVKPIGRYETRILCENQQYILNKYHNSQHFLCVVEDK